MTYTASNVADHYTGLEWIDHKYQKLLFVFLINTTCGLAKDRAYAQHFGASTIKPFPISALGFFFARDIIAIASAFTLPPILGKILSSKYDITEKSG
jgi:hypothetical protein